MPEAVAPPTPWRSLTRDVVAIGWLGVSTAAVYVLLVLGTEVILRPEQEALLRLFVLPSLPLAAAVSLLRARAIAETFLRLQFLVGFLVLMWASVAWSLDPAVSLRRAALVSAYTVISVWLVITYDPAALIRRLAWLFLAIILLSAAFAVLLPHLAWQPLDGRVLLRGVFSHKNELGLHLGSTAILMATAWQFRLIPRWVAALGLLSCLGMAWPTGSATTFLILAVLALIRLVMAIVALPGRIADKDEEQPLGHLNDEPGPGNVVGETQDRAQGLPIQSQSRQPAALHGKREQQEAGRQQLLADHAPDAAAGNSNGDAEGQAGTAAEELMAADGAKIELAAALCYQRCSEHAEQHDGQKGQEHDDEPGLAEQPGEREGNETERDDPDGARHERERECRCELQLRIIVAAHEPVMHEARDEDHEDEDEAEPDGAQAERVGPDQPSDDDDRSEADGKRADRLDPRPQ